VEARFVRIYPQTWIEAIALRIELLGCASEVPETTSAEALGMRITTAPFTTETTTTTVRATARGTTTVHVSVQPTSEVTSTTPVSKTTNSGSGTPLFASAIVTEPTPILLRDIQQLKVQFNMIMEKLERLRIGNITAAATDRVKYSVMRLQKILVKFVSFNFSYGANLPQSAEYSQQLADFHGLLNDLRGEIVMLETMLSLSSFTVEEKQHSSVSQSKAKCCPSSEATTDA
jgi:hypothetical protein